MCIRDRVSVNEGEVFFNSDRSQYGIKQKVSIDYDENYYQYPGTQKINGVTYFVDVSTLNLYQSDSCLLYTSHKWVQY